MMKRHPTRALLLGYDGHTIAGARRGRVAAHLIACTRCRARLTRLQDIRAAVGHITTPVVPDLWPAIRARLAAAETVILPVAEPAQPLARRRLGVVAAVVSLLLAGAVAAAVAVDPVRLWISETIARLGAAGPSAAASGVELVVSGDMDIVLVNAAPDLRIYMQVADVELLQVSGLGAAADARFEVGAQSVRVLEASGGELRVVVPLTATVRLVSGDSTLAAMSAGRAPVAGTLRELLLSR
jgi:hypothetical protein